MIVLSVIERELRAAARQPLSYYIRLLGLLAVLLVCWIIGSQHRFSSGYGSKLFASLHLTLFCSIWVLVPSLTADCISCERREGTLGLLFLTKLSATTIITAKSLVHGLRALTLWLAVVPALTIPFLMGGVSWMQALLSAGINFSAICLALAAGLLASAWSKCWPRALAGAYLLAGFLLVAFGIMVGEIISGGLGVPGWTLLSLVDSAYGIVIFGPNAFGPGYSRSFGFSTGQLLWSLAMLLAICCLVLLCSMLLAARRIGHVWQERPASRLQRWWETTFCTPIFWLAFFRAWMLRKLEHNPIGWLEQRTWSGRLIIWGWLAIIISLYCAALTDRNFFRSYGSMQRAMAWLLAGSLAMSSAGSFRRERETGLLELLLVSPLREQDLIWGRVRGLWSQFLPAFVLLMGVWVYLGNLGYGFGGRPSSFHFITFLTLPVTGLYFSLRCRTFVAAFLCTLLVGLVAPLILIKLPPSAQTNSPGEDFLALAALLQVLFAGACGLALHGRLKQRSFPLNPGSRH